MSLSLQNNHKVTLQISKCKSFMFPKKKIKIGHFLLCLNLKSMEHIHIKNEYKAFILNRAFVKTMEIFDQIFCDLYVIFVAREARKKSIFAQS